VVVDDPDPTLHFDADPDSLLHMVEHLKFFVFVQRGASLNCFIFLFSVIGVNILDSTYIEIFWKNKITVSFTFG
jgi:hypothetical protein